MWVLLASEALLFTALLALYSGYRGLYPEAFSRGIDEGLKIAGTLNTAILLVSSYLVALAVHRQLVRNQTFDTAPLHTFGNFATWASINVQPDPEGRIRAIQTVSAFADTTVPTMSAWLAGAHDVAGREILIDFSIDPATIPQLSYIDVLNGWFDAAEIAGKAVLIGPVAIELDEPALLGGDRDEAVSLFVPRDVGDPELVAAELFGRGAKRHVLRLDDAMLRDRPVVDLRVFSASVAQALARERERAARRHVGRSLELARILGARLVGLEGHRLAVTALARLQNAPGAGSLDDQRHRRRMREVHQHTAVARGAAWTGGAGEPPHQLGVVGGIHLGVGSGGLGPAA